jgi:hypothetical protein
VALISAAVQSPCSGFHVLHMLPPLLTVHLSTPGTIHVVRDAAQSTIISTSYQLSVSLQAE